VTYNKIGKIGNKLIGGLGPLGGGDGDGDMAIEQELAQKAQAALRGNAQVGAPMVHQKTRRKRGEIRRKTLEENPKTRENERKRKPHGPRPLTAPPYVAGFSFLRLAVAVAIHHYLSRVILLF
jgi:hypothetical protein